MPLNPTHAVIVDCYQGNGQWFPETATQRVDALIAQVSRGLHVDTEFRRSHDTCVLRGTPFMAYNQYVAVFEWKKQADLILELIVGLNVKKLWWAYDSAGLNAGKLNKTTAIASMNGVKYLKANFGKVGFYGNRNDIAQLYKDAPEARNEDLWLARYPLSQFWWNNVTDPRPENAPPKWTTDIWKHQMWQFASEGNWLGKTAGHAYGFPNSWSVDINVWDGTPEQMRAELGAVNIPIPPTDKEKLELVYSWYLEEHRN